MYLAVVDGLERISALSMFSMFRSGLGSFPDDKSSGFFFYYEGLAVSAVLISATKSFAWASIYLRSFDYSTGELLSSF